MQNPIISLLCCGVCGFRQYARMAIASFLCIKAKNPLQTWNLLVVIEIVCSNSAALSPWQVKVSTRPSLCIASYLSLDGQVLLMMFLHLFKMSSWGRSLPNYPLLQMNPEIEGSQNISITSQNYPKTRCSTIMPYLLRMSSWGRSPPNWAPPSPSIDTLPPPQVSCYPLEPHIARFRI